MNRHEINMTEGSLFPKLIMFALPAMFSGMIQLFFNAADLIVVGRFAGEEALAAVGANSSVIALLVHLFLGMSTGTSVVVAKFYGAKDLKNLGETVSTTIIFALAGGVMFAITGNLLARPLLVIMGTPADVLPLAETYLRIYLSGLPVIALYNFASAVLRSVGDTVRPLIYLSIAGVVNFGLNLFFVIVCGMDVDGVAIATVTSQLISGGLTLLTLIRTDGVYKLNIKKYGFSWSSFGKIIRIGLPAGIQNVLFSISNVLIQSSVNSFGTDVIAGNSAAYSIEQFAFTSQDAVTQSAIASVSQNMGARQYNRTKKCVLYCTILEVVVWLTMGGIIIAFRRQLLGIYTQVPAAIDAGCRRMLIMAGTFVLNGIQHMMTGTLRGHGYSVAPTLVSIAGICGFRIFWICTFFAQYRTIEMLFVSYPISWILTGGTGLVLYFALRNRAFAKNERKFTVPCGNEPNMAEAN